MNISLQTITSLPQSFLAASWKKKILILAGIAIVLWLAVPRVLVKDTQKQQYQTAQAERGTLVVSVSGSGQVSGANSTPINTQLSGVVEEIYAGNGSYVEAGKPVAKIALDEDSQQKQMQAYSTYLTAVNQLKTAQQNKETNDAQMWQAQQSVLQAQNDVDYKNNNLQNPSTKQSYTDLERQSIDSQLVQAQKAFAAAEKKYKESDNSIAAAQAAVNSAWSSYQQISNTIIAPISGTVADLNIQIGTIISGQSSSSSSSSSTSTQTSSSTSSKKVGVIKTTGTPTITVNLSEIDIPKVKVGNRATISLDAFPGKTYTGRVTAIDTSGSVSSGVVTYPVTISLSETTSSIYANMTATANIITDTRDNVVTVPVSAVQTVDGQSSIRILKNGAVSTVTVETGASSDIQIEIISGVKEGDTVVTGTFQQTTQRSGTTTSPFGGGFGARGFGGGNAVRIQR